MMIVVIFFFGKNDDFIQNLSKFCYFSSNTPHFSFKCYSKTIFICFTFWNGNIPIQNILFSYFLIVYLGFVGSNACFSIFFLHVREEKNLRDRCHVLFDLAHIVRKTINFVKRLSFSKIIQLDLTSVWLLSMSSHLSETKTKSRCNLMRVNFNAKTKKKKLERDGTIFFLFRWIGSISCWY